YDVKTGPAISCHVGTGETHDERACNFLVGATGVVKAKPFGVPEDESAIESALAAQGWIPDFRDELKKQFQSTEGGSVSTLVVTDLKKNNDGQMGDTFKKYHGKADMEIVPYKSEMKGLGSGFEASLRYDHTEGTRLAKLLMAGVKGNSNLKVFEANQSL